MSHNINTINAKEPDRTGAITEALGDLSDVTLTSVADTQALVYDNASSEWINSTNPSTLGSVFCGEGAAQNYSGSSASSVGNGATVEFYASSPHNSISATITSASNWVSQITVGIGTYRVSALVALTFSSAGSGQYRVHEGATAVGSTGTYAQDDEDCSNIATAIVEVTSGTKDLTIRLTTAATNINTIANQGTRQAELGFFIVDRIG
jgi:hypothetical protein